MQEKKLLALIEALDTSLASVAEQRLPELTKRIPQEQVAQAIIHVLKACEGLQNGTMPIYNEWDSFYYPVWYQPSHINMAYSLIQKIPVAVNPLMSGKGDLCVYDIGCGQGAMRFALLLAASEALDKHIRCPQITIRASDPARAMTEMGAKLWDAFIEEINNYPALDSVREASKLMQYIESDQIQKQENVLWFSLLHVAYAKTAKELKQKTSLKISNSNPEVVLVTCHPGASGNAFVPEKNWYGESLTTVFPSQEQFSLYGDFERASEFRKKLYNEYIAQKVLPYEDGFARGYLTSHPTAFVTYRFEAQGSIYMLTPSTEIDDLPF